LSTPRTNGRIHWITLSLAALGCAGALAAFRSLSASAERGRAGRAAPAAESEAAPELVAPPAAAGPAEHREAARPLAGASELDAELLRRVQDATDQLASALELPDYEVELWHAEVETRARTLGRVALPALRSILADESQSVETHVSATELVAALQP